MDRKPLQLIMGAEIIARLPGVASEFGKNRTITKNKYNNYRLFPVLLGVAAEKGNLSTVRKY